MTDATQQVLPTRRPFLVTLKPDEALSILINRESTGLSDMLSKRAEERGWRALVTDTSKLCTTASPTGKSTELEALEHTLATGPRIHQCIVFLHMDTLCPQDQVPCNPGDKKLLELCKENNIPTLVVLVPWTFTRPPDTSYTTADAGQNGLIGQLIKLQLPSGANLVKASDPKHVLRQMQYVTGLEILIGEQFQYLPDIVRNGDMTAAIVCNV